LLLPDHYIVRIKYFTRRSVPARTALTSLRRHASFIKHDDRRQVRPGELPHLRSYQSEPLGDQVLRPLHPAGDGRRRVEPPWSLSRRTPAPPTRRTSPGRTRTDARASLGGTRCPTRRAAPGDRWRGPASFSERVFASTASDLSNSSEAAAGSRWACASSVGKGPASIALPPTGRKPRTSVCYCSGHLLAPAIPCPRRPRPRPRAGARAGARAGVAHDIGARTAFWCYRIVLRHRLVWYAWP